MKHSMSILYTLRQLLNELTDGNHPLNANQLAEMLSDKYNINVERKAIYRGIDALLDADIEIARIGNAFGNWLY